MIEETNGDSSAKFPVLKREIDIPLDSSGKHVYRQIHRANRQLIYRLIDSGYLSAVRCIYDLLQYEEKNEEEK